MAPPRTAPPEPRPAGTNPLTRRVGPLPLWLWLAGTAVLLFALYKYRSSSPAAAPADTGLQPSSIGYTPPADQGAGGGISGVPPDAAAPASPAVPVGVVTIEDSGANGSVGAAAATANAYQAPSYTGVNGETVTPTTYAALGLTPEPITSGMVSAPDYSLLDSVQQPGVYPVSPSTKGADTRTVGGVLAPDWTGA